MGVSEGPDLQSVLGWSSFLAVSLGMQSCPISQPLGRQACLELPCHTHGFLWRSRLVCAEQLTHLGETV